MSAYRAAVIGLGRMGSTFDDEILRGGSFFLPYCHAPSYSESRLVDLVAGADLHPEQRSLFGERWGLTDDHLYEDYNEMLAQEQPDIVSICTTPRHRRAIVQDVAQAGVKAIWAEKPLSLSLEDGDDIVRVCREERVAIAVNCQRRWNPLFSEAKRIIEAGDLGKILQVNVHGNFGLSSNGSHMLDTVRYLAGGEIEWVFGEMESDEVAASDDDPKGNGYLAFDNGVRSFVRSMPSGASLVDIDIIGEQATIRSTENGWTWELIRLASSDYDRYSMRPHSSRFPGPLAVKYPFPWPNRIQGIGLSIVEDLVSAIETGQPPRCSGEGGLIALEIAIAMRESHRRGGVKVNLPLEDRKLKILSSEIKGDDVPRRIREQMT